MRHSPWSYFTTKASSPYRSRPKKPKNLLSESQAHDYLIPRLSSSFNYLWENSAKMPTMWLSDSQSTSSIPENPGQELISAQCAENIRTSMKRDRKHFTDWKCRDWSGILFRWWVCLVPMCYGASLSADCLGIGGFFLIGGVLMFFDRAMYVSLSSPLFISPQLTAHLQACNGQCPSPRPRPALTPTLTPTNLTQ